MTRTRFVRIAVGLAIVALTVSSPAFAQRGGGGGGGGGGTALMSRLDQLTVTLTLDKNQKNQAKKLLDDAHKRAAPIRQQLTATRAAIVAAIEAGKTQPDIDAAAKAYAASAAAMAAEEMKALTAIAQALSPEQRANAASLQTAVYLVRGIFIDDKKWNVIPDGRGY